MLFRTKSLGQQYLTGCGTVEEEDCSGVGCQLGPPVLTLLVAGFH